MLSLRNEYVQVELNPDRGAEITAIIPAHTPRNVLAFYDWGSPVPANGLIGYGSSDLDWLSGYRGGWQETVPNSGSASHLDGMPLPFHGEGSIIPWAVIEQSPTSCLMETNLRPTLCIRRRMSLLDDMAGVEVVTTVTNTGLQDVPMLWGHHPAFVCDENTYLHMPPGRFTVEPTQRDRIASDGEWPTAMNDDGIEVDLSRLEPTVGSRLIYRYGHDEGWAVLRQAGGQSHIAIAWDVHAYPSTWIWQNRSHPSFPWFGRMRSLAVEPQRAWPSDGLAGARDRGQELSVRPGENRSSWMVVACPQMLPAEISGVTRTGTVTACGPV